MSTKSGQARVPTTEEWQTLFNVIEKKRYPEKNAAIMHISHRLGLRVQEIALLEIKEVAKLFGNPGSANRKFERFKVMALPASITKGSNATSKSTSRYIRKNISFSVSEFEKMLKHVIAVHDAGFPIDPTEFYPDVKKRSGKSRDLPMVKKDLCDALDRYLKLRLDKNLYLKPTDPLFITQKGGPYTPNTLQEHMAMMLRDWAGIEKATSHSGRRTMITDIIHTQKKSIKIAQKLAGHKSAATTVIYEEPPEEEMSEALKNLK